MDSSKKIFISLTHYLLEGLIAASDITIDAFFPPRRPMSGLMRRFLSYRWRRRVPSRPTISTLLSQLQRQGLVQRSGSRRFSRWRITPRGRRLVLRYRKAITSPAVVPVFSEGEPDGIVRIVTFDIPERERRKRDVLRECLKMINFRLLQKSVWVGDVPLPEDLVRYLHERDIFRYLHVVSIRERGTMEEES